MWAMEVALMEAGGEAKEVAALAVSLRCHLERCARAGVQFVARKPEPETRTKAAGEDLSLLGGVEKDLFAQANPAYEARSLEELLVVIGDCRRCKLCAGRTHIVFGVGNPKARLMFIGEGPGRDEDLQGEPFVGRAGQLLTDIITKGMGLKREDVYIANVVKCRPPDNRNPEPDEVAACEPFLRKQIELINPEIIVALGKFAVQTLLQSKAPITKIRGQWHSYHGIKLMPTFHPAYLLRNPGDKKLVWEDIKKVIEARRRA
jgi:DNA polymerase